MTEEKGAMWEYRPGMVVMTGSDAVPFSPYERLTIDLSRLPGHFTLRDLAVFAIEMGYVPEIHLDKRLP